MPNLPVLGCSAGTKSVKTKVGAKSSSMMARLLVITRSSRDIDLNCVIGKYEFSTTKRMLMTAEGNVHPCTDKSQLIHRLTDTVTVISSNEDKVYYR